MPSRSVVLYVQAANLLAQPRSPTGSGSRRRSTRRSPWTRNDARANYVAGIALANSGDGKGAITFLQKAKANAGSDISLNADIDTALKKLSPPKP